jgi:hypothetical protein
LTGAFIIFVVLFALDLSKVTGLFQLQISGKDLKPRFVRFLSRNNLNK